MKSPRLLVPKCSDHLAQLPAIRAKNLHTGSVLLNLLVHNRCFPLQLPVTQRALFTFAARESLPEVGDHILEFARDLTHIVYVPLHFRGERLKLCARRSDDCNAKLPNGNSLKARGERTGDHSTSLTLGRPTDHWSPAFVKWCKGAEYCFSLAKIPEMKVAAATSDAASSGPCTWQAVRFFVREALYSEDCLTTWHTTARHQAQARCLPGASNCSLCAELLEPVC